MFKHGRYIEISKEKEQENEYEYMLKINLPDRQVIYQKARIIEIEADGEDAELDSDGKYTCSIIFKTKYIPDELIYKKKKKRDYDIDDE